VTKMHELEFLVAKHFGEIDRVWRCKVCGQVAYSRSWFVKYPKCNLEMPQTREVSDK
jgi:rubrerythrin